jgi:hypothetical protein
MVPETGWLIGLGISFVCGALLGYALKVKQHDREIETILNITRRHRQEVIAKKETPQAVKGPGRSTFGTI